jgi:hypothetical protein
LDIYVYTYICIYVCMCVCALYIHQSEIVAAVAPSGIGWIYDTFWIASRRVARAAIVGFAQVRKKEKCHYVVGSNGRVHAVKARS